MMKLHKNHILAACLATGLALSGCGDKLEVTPVAFVSEETALNTSANVLVVLDGAYDNLSGAGMYGGQLLITSELLANSGEVRWKGTFNDPLEIADKSMVAANGWVAATWIRAYATINNVNNVLSAINVVDADERNRVEGEALFIRGSVYFELTRFFGKQYESGQASTNLGVPLILTPTRGINDASYVSRNTVEQCYAQVIADLTKAETLLENSDNVLYGSKAAVAAMLARVYLQKGDYAAARDAANRVITSGGYSLDANFANIFGNSLSSENIFMIPVSEQDGLNSMNLFFASKNNGGRSDIPMQTAHFAIYEAGDERADFFYSDETFKWTLKWRSQFGDVNVIRLAEMYLIRAEANQRLGTSVGATPAADLNAIRSRAGLDPVTATLDNILMERRRELAFEGARLHDVKRLKQAVGALPAGSPRLILPIPQRETDANKNLVQNEGY